LRHIVVTSQAAGRSVFSESLIEQSFKSGFQNSQSLMRTVCGSEFQTLQTVVKTGKHAKSVSSWTVAPAAGWQ